MSRPSSLPARPSCPETCWKQVAARPDPMRAPRSRRKRARRRPAPALRPPPSRQRRTAAWWKNRPRRWPPQRAFFRQRRYGTARTANTARYGRSAPLLFRLFGVDVFSHFSHKAGGAHVSARFPMLTGVQTCRPRGEKRVAKHVADKVRRPADCRITLNGDSRSGRKAKGWVDLNCCCSWVDLLRCAPPRTRTMGGSWRTMGGSWRKLAVVRRSPRRIWRPCRKEREGNN